MDDADARRVRLIKERRYLDAIAVQAERLATQPLNSELHHQMAWLLAAVRNFTAAAAHESIACALQPDNPKYLEVAASYCAKMSVRDVAEETTAQAKSVEKQALGATPQTQPTGMIMNPYSTHQALLVAALAHTNGAILELGGGWYSTPLVSSFSNAFCRSAITVETGRYVYGLLKRLETMDHRILLMEGFEFDRVGKFKLEPGKTVDEYKRMQLRFLQAVLEANTPSISVALVDQAPGFLRAPAIELLADKAEFIVVHDTEHVSHYHYEPVLSSFRSRWDFVLHRPNSTVLSNTHDCSIFSYLSGQN